MSSRTVHFFFENRRIEGIEGEPVAKSLFTAGIRTLSYSVKYKRPRGIHCARGRCIMCHMEVDGVPGVPTCVIPLRAGMHVRRENFRPFFAPLLIWAIRLLSFPAGFYYRMFTRPALLRKFFLGSLRRMAGVGRASVTRAPSRRETAPPTPASVTCKRRYDVIVVGAGISGMSAALAAAERGAAVLLVDEYATPGGHTIGRCADPVLAQTRDQCITRLAETNELHYCPGTTAQAFYPPDTLLLGPGGAVGFGACRTNDGAWSSPGGKVTIGTAMRRVSANAFIFAAGCYDIVPMFENSELPGIFGSRAIRLLLERDGWRPGSRAVAYGTGPALDDLVDLLRHHHVQLAAVVDAAPAADRRKSADAVHELAGARVVRAAGRHWVRSVVARTAEGAETRIECDMLCTAFRGQGAYELPYQSGFSFAMSGDALEENRVMAPGTDHLESRTGIRFYLAGELSRAMDWREKVATGTNAGLRAAEALKTRNP